MPVPSCLGLEVSADKVSLRAAPSASEHAPFLEQKSTHSDGFAAIGTALLKQQGMLEHIMELQRDLQVLVQQQHETLESKLGCVASYGDAAIKEPEERARNSETNTPSNARNSRRSFQTKTRLLTFNMDPSIHEITPPESVSANMIDASGGFLSRFPRTVQALVVHPMFESLVGVVIILNFLVLCIEFQLKGQQHRYILGQIDQPDYTWSNIEGLFSVLSKCFNVLYVVELFLRVGVYRLAFCRDVLNVLDGLIVLAAAIDGLVLDAITQDSAKLIGLMRLVRVARLARVLLVLRLFRTLSLLGAFRVLLKTIQMSLESLVCSMALVFFIVVIAALVMVQLTTSFIEDDSQSQMSREWMYKHYGSALRASYTMFEATFSAKWATHLARPTIEEISSIFSIFWIIYTVAINFAVIRIISALFLKQTMALAAIDAEKAAAEKVKEKQKIVTTLRAIFKLGDQGGDGELGPQDFSQMMENPEVLKKFEELELETYELRLLFDLLSEDDGVADQEEFLFGAMKLKNHVKIVDMIQLLHQQAITIKALDQLRDTVEQMNQTKKPNTGPSSPAPVAAVVQN